MSTYAAELNDDNIVVRVIVGAAEWAADMLGGRWVDSPVKVGAGWVWDGEAIVPPVVEDPGDEFDDLLPDADA
jgi:hypothetical protein